LDDLLTISRKLWHAGVKKIHHSLTWNKINQKGGDGVNEIEFGPSKARTRGESPMAINLAVLTLPGLIDPGLAIAASRAGELGILDLEYPGDPCAARSAVKTLGERAKSGFGIKLNGNNSELIAELIGETPDNLKTVVLTSANSATLGPVASRFHEHNLEVLLEANCLDQARVGQANGVDGIIAKGHEGGGRVSEETTFVLVQRFLSELRVPVWAHGGIGLHTAAACAAVGVVGVILDSQLALTHESPLAEAVRSRIANMDGSETICLGKSIGETYRVYFRPGSRAVEELRRVETRLSSEERPEPDVLADWRKAITERTGWGCPDQDLLLLGQDAAFAEPLAKKFATVGRVLRAMRAAVAGHCQTACQLRPLDAGAPLAGSHGTRYPILQGPMTRVSDIPEFAAQVAEGGALPFLALALLRGSEVEALLAETRQRLGTHPWGVGILGFVPAELRQEQLDVIRDYRPPFALIAGGRPDQARALEEQGISTYLHVPSPGLLKMFLQQGARRFVFEGRECGGHVGPRPSFVLWNQMIDALLEALAADPRPEDYHIVFAGGIHDSLSAAMVAAMAAQLAEHGARIGVLLGTAYLFTEEAVTAGAIVKAFQQQALHCENTVLLESGPGHSTRCIDTPFADTFGQEKSKLLKAGASGEEMRLALEELNLGRLRIASKGITRAAKFGQEPEAAKFSMVNEHQQVAEGMYMIGQVATMRSRTCTIEALHRDVAVEGSNRVQALPGEYSQSKSVKPAESPADIAIIGMSCLLPKAPDLETYWENILNKVDAITEIPKDRWDWRLYFDPDPKAHDKIYSKWGGFIDDVAFDPMQYGMPPASLRSIEPGQLLTLEVVRVALKDAGYLDRPFPRERTSVILGSGGGAADLGLGYGGRAFVPNLELLPEFRGRSPELLDRLSDVLPEWTEDSFAGILTNVSAGRVANRFDLGGTNYTVDAACASSLAAVSLAVTELETNRSDMVIVGGVDTMQNPFTYLCFSKTKALSPRGRCRTFDESADGIVISEGLAIIVLKRLVDAERDGDRIYAVIKGVGSSSDGKDKGLTAPRPEGQARALRRAYAKANFSPATVGLIEAHGTGTVAGDRAEVGALTGVFSEAGAQPQHCAIGSVKSMIGHTKCTAGAAGLVKTALALHHRVLPPTLGVERPNPSVNFSETPFFVNGELQPWLDDLDDHPRRAGVSAFGFGGTNFHVVLEEYTGDVASPRSSTLQRWPAELFLWQGDSRQALLEAVELCDKALAGDTQPQLRDLAYTIWKLGDQKFPDKSAPLRLAVIATSVEDLRQKIASAHQAIAKPDTAQVSDPRGIYFCEQRLGQGDHPAGKLAFLFPGQGSQYPNMLRELTIQFPEAWRVVELGNRVLAGKLAKSLSAYIFPPCSFSPEEKRAQQQALTQTNVAQPALGVAGLAMFRVLQSLGLSPDFVAGHSYGEYVALAAAGVFTEEGLIALSEARGRFIVEAAGEEPGVMAAVEAEAEVVSRSLNGIAGVNIANSNAPRQTVISGSRSGVEEAVERLSARGITARMIPVACAFHSPIVAPAQQQLAEFLSTVELTEPQITIFSNTTAAAYPIEPAAISARLLEHLVRPVEFMHEIEAMYAAGARIFVEVGPRGVLTSLADQILGDRPRLAVASDQSGRSGLVQLLHMLGQLAAHGVEMKLDRLYQGRSVERLDLSRLEDETQKIPLAATAWLVNGGRAKPSRQTKDQSAMTSEKVVSPATLPLGETSRLRMETSAVAASPGISPVPSGAVGNGKLQTIDEVPLTPNRSAAVQPAPMAHSDNGISTAMAQFQQLMARFLDVQKSVMLSYLESASGSMSFEPAAGTDLLQAIPAVLEPLKDLQPSVAQSTRGVGNGTAATIPQPIAAASLPSVSPNVQEPELRQSGQPDLNQISSILVSIVSERTGYPPEMLDLDLDLEADLGIDSIKRVEILGNFQQSAAAVSLTDSEGLMDKLAGAKTLRSIIDRIIDQLSLDSRADRSEAPAVSKSTSEPIANNLHDADKIASRLLAIVSERTGYPADMLDLDLDLEADLGIDSIKRVEILGNFQQTLEAGAGQGDGLLEKLSGAKTLRGIIDRIVEQLSLEAQPNGSEPPSAELDLSKKLTSSPASSESGDELQTLSRIERYTLTAVEAPRRRSTRTLVKDRVVLLTEDELGVAQALLTELEKRGQRAAIVRSGQTACVSDKGGYVADLSTPQAVAQLMDIIHQTQGPLGGIVHLRPLCKGVEFAGIELPSWRERLRLQTKSLFYLVKAAAEDLREAARAGGACVIGATGMGGAFLSDPSVDAKDCFAGQGGVSGLIKTLAREWPGVLVKAVDLDPGEPAQTLANHLLEECTQGDEQVEVGYDGHRRLVLQPRHAPLDQQRPSTFNLDESSVVLITGGARGITAQAARQFAEHYQPKLLLVGRSPLPDPEESPDTAGLISPRELKAALMEQLRNQGQSVTPARVEEAYARLGAQREIRDNIEAMRGLGATVHYYSVDVRDGEAFGSLIDQIYHTFGRLDGVVHGAGVIEDKLIQDKTTESFDRVFDTKADSAFILSQKLRPEKLQFLAFFASVAGRFGNRGQGDYAAANEVLNKLAVQLDREWPGRVVSVNWGPWDTNGMVSPEVSKQFAERGVELIPAAVGLRRLQEELQYGRKREAEVVIGGVGSQPAANQVIQRPILSQHFWPLIKRATISRANGSIELVRKLEPDYDRYLNDHRLDGRPVFPVAMATELMAEVAAQGWPDLHVAQVRDLFVLHGIMLQDGAKTVRVVGKTQPIAAQGQLSIALEIAATENPQRIHYRAVVDLVEHLPDPPSFEPLSPATQRALSIDLSEIYREWLFHGPLFQGVRDIAYIGNDGVVAVLASSSPRGWIAEASDAPWLIDPLMFDSGLQLLILWSREHWDMTTLPSRFKAYRRFGAEPSEQIHCEVRIRPNTGNQTIHADIVFADTGGKVVGILEDAEGSCTRALNRLMQRTAEAPFQP
jgi:acyl transferase domain-containing protein/NAD(P)H-dependent flavin oxidoreductase YrpB (nitropropane dioxygenase family)/NAD(P)-dependent dehydrogenase (short-subunit alcohol dehydrogenase family)/acyl carrier protein